MDIQLEDGTMLSAEFNPYKDCLSIRVSRADFQLSKYVLMELLGMLHIALKRESNDKG